MIWSINIFLIFFFLHIFSGKKGKKSKGKTLALNEFLSEGPGGPPPAMAVPRKSQNWADEVENDDGEYFAWHPITHFIFSISFLT